MTKSLKLNEEWDISLNASGDLSTTDGKYRVAQDIANAVRLFLGEALFYQNRGVPHFLDNLGKDLEGAILRAGITEAALNVPDVLSVQVTDIKVSGRVLTADIIITDAFGGLKKMVSIKKDEDNFYTLINVYEERNIYNLLENKEI